jgi:hypothetical protein
MPADYAPLARLLVRAADVGGYSAGLALFRMGDHNRWVRWSSSGPKS